MRSSQLGASVQSASVAAMTSCAAAAMATLRPRECSRRARDDGDAVRFLEGLERVAGRAAVDVDGLVGRAGLRAQ
jgi:hypothetical protein